jgi:hypothetical protein
VAKVWHRQMTLSYLLIAAISAFTAIGASAKVSEAFV